VRSKTRVNVSWLSGFLALLLALSACSPGSSPWTPRTSGTSRALWAVTYGGGQFVAVGSGGTIRTSPDGVSWTSQTSGTSSGLYSIAYGGGQFVAVGDAGTILTSP
jgi:hypothetical protein